MHNFPKLWLLFLLTFSAPSAPPQNLTGYAASPTIIYLSWNPPPTIDINGILQHYWIGVQESETGRSWSFIHVEGEIAVGSLHPYYNYWCRVSAYTIGLGPYTNQIVVQTQEAGNFSALVYLAPAPCIVMDYSEQST